MLRYLPILCNPFFCFYAYAYISFSTFSFLSVAFSQYQMATGATRKVSAASARAHTRTPKPVGPSQLAGIFKKVLLVSLVGFLSWVYQTARPPPPKICGSKGGPPVTASRIQLKDGRYLAFKEFGIPKENAQHKIIFIHGLDSCRHDVLCITRNLSSEFVESHGLYIVSLDRAGYGESDPNPKQTVKSTAFDIEEVADQLGLGSKFYVVGFSMGGQIVWTCLKYIPHRLAGVALLAPVVNYWWQGIPKNLSREAYKQFLPQDQWALWIIHHMPWLTYWWNTQKLFPGFSLIGHSTEVLSRHDLELLPKYVLMRQPYQAQVRQQGEYGSIHRDLAIGFGTWEFDPMELKNEGIKVQIWQGDEDLLVPAMLQRYIAHQLPWIKYNEIAGVGHLFPCADGMSEKFLHSLI